MNHGYLLPEQLTDHELDCVQFYIPRDEKYRAAFWGALTTLTKWFNWETTGDQSGAIASQYWKQILRHVEIGNCEGGDSAVYDLQLDGCLLSLTKDGSIIKTVDLSACAQAVIDDAELPEPGDIPQPDIKQPGDTDPGSNLCGIATYVADTILNDYKQMLQDYILEVVTNGVSLLDFAETFIAEALILPELFAKFVASLQAIVATGHNEIYNEVNRTSFAEHFRCALYCVMPNNGIDRNVIADWKAKLQELESGYAAHGVNGITAYMDALPLSDYRLYAFIAGEKDEYADCSNCDCCGEQGEYNPLDENDKYWYAFAGSWGAMTEEQVGTSTLIGRHTNDEFVIDFGKPVCFGAMWVWHSTNAPGTYGWQYIDVWFDDVLRWDNVRTWPRQYYGSNPSFQLTGFGNNLTSVSKITIKGTNPELPGFIYKIRLFINDVDE